MAAEAACARKSEMASGAAAAAAPQRIKHISMAKAEISTLSVKNSAAKLGKASVTQRR